MQRNEPENPAPRARSEAGSEAKPAPPLSPNGPSSRGAKTSEGWDDTYLLDLFSALRDLENVEEFRRFFDDLCTPAELRSMADRWRVAQLLSQGFSYRVINEKTGVSTATITRVARSLTYGAGGYRMILSRAKGDTP